MDNSRTIPGYKFHVDARTGERPHVFVTSLNVEPVPESKGAWHRNVEVPGTAGVNGLAFAVDRADLELFDVRERQYVRREVTGLIDADLGGPVFAYVGRAEARERYERAVAAGLAVVSREYHDEVRAGFALLGDDQLALYDATTDPPAVPLSDLRRIAVPAAGAPSTSAPPPPPAPSRSPGAA